MSRLAWPAVLRPAHPTSWIRLGTAPLCVALSIGPAWWSTTHAWPDQGPLGALALLPVLAALVGWRALRREPTGPSIHDRQLDLIVAVLAAVAAAELLHLAQEDGSGSFAMAGASCLMAVAILAAGWGSRALWQVRWAVLLLALTWQYPWAEVGAAAWPAVRSIALSVGSALPGVDAQPTADGRALIVVSDGAEFILDPAAGGSVLLLVLAGTLVGAALATGQTRRRGAAVALVGGPLLGMGLAALTWLVAVACSSATGTVAARAWNAGSLQASLLLASGGVAVLTVGLWAARSRRQPTVPDVAASSRLAEAVPRLRASTAVIAVLSGVFLLLQMGAAPPSHRSPTPPTTAAVGSGAHR